MTDKSNKQECLWCHVAKHLVWEDSNLIFLQANTNKHQLKVVFKPFKNLLWSCCSVSHQSKQIMNQGMIRFRWLKDKSCHGDVLFIWHEQSLDRLSQIACKEFSFYWLMKFKVFILTCRGESTFCIMCRLWSIGNDIVEPCIE